MELLDYKIIDEPKTGTIHKRRPDDMHTQADGGLQVKLTGNFRCQVCKHEMLHSSGEFEIEADRNAIGVHVSKNLTWLAERLCKKSLLCTGCGFSSQCSQADYNRVLHELQTTVTEAWILTKLEKAGITLGTIREIGY